MRRLDETTSKADLGLIRTLLVVGGIVGGITQYERDQQIIVLFLLFFMTSALIQYTFVMTSPNDSRSSYLRAFLAVPTSIFFSLVLTSVFILNGLTILSAPLYIAFVIVVLIPFLKSEYKNWKA
ncbi:MAG: hypothetical protein JRN68_06590 [Nitrososphaerota archaeon]|nr:hypothetical protein [Nitrososphaerota archaeon]